MKQLIISLVLCGSAFASGTCTTGAIAQAASGSTPATISGCWYVDFASGVDTNAGTTEGAPFLHAPGMANCVSSCASASVVAGNGIIVKGGTTCGNACYPWTMPSGSGGNPVYIGVDKTWFTGGSYAKPILNPGGSLIGTADTMASIPSNTYVDNFEVTGYFWNATVTCTTNGIDCELFNMGQDTGQVVENMYIHGWTHSGTNSGTSAGVATIFFTGGTIIGTASISHDNLATGADISGDHSMNMFFGGPPISYNNTCIQMSSCYIVNYPQSVHDNLISNVGPAYCNVPTAGFCTHENGYEDNGDLGSNFYNNVITNIGAGLALWIAVNPTYTTYMWNNVIYNVQDNQILDMAPPVYNSTYCSSGATGNNYCLTAGDYVFENNTVQCGDDSTQYDDCQSLLGVVGSGSIANSFIYHNNHFVTNTTTSGCSSGTGHATSCTFAADNLVQTQSTANGQGYNSGQTYAFYPTSGGSTIGFGSNLTAGWPGANTNDTTYGCTDVSNVSTCPARTSTTRPSSGAWDAGAYEFLAGAGSGTVVFSGTVSINGANVLVQ